MAAAVAASDGGGSESVYLSAEQAAIINAAANARGLDVADFLRYAALEKAQPSGFVYQPAPLAPVHYPVTWTYPVKWYS